MGAMMEVCIGYSGITKSLLSIGIFTVYRNVRWSDGKLH